MSKNPVYATIAVSLSLLLALGAPVGLAAQSNASSGTQTQGTPAQPQQAATAQTAKEPMVIPAGPNYSKNIPWFPRGITPYMPQQVPEPVMVNSPTLQQLIQQGKLQLSLEQAIQLAVQNNLNIGIQRYVSWVAQTSVLSAMAGPPGLSFDPTLSSTLSLTSTSSPVNNPFTSGTGTVVNSLTSKRGIANFTFSKGFRTGTSFSLGFNNSRSSTSSSATFLNPSVQSSLSFGFQQELLRGFGFLPNMQYIIEARNSSQAAVDNLENEVITVVANVATAYWNLVYARENVNVQQTSVNWAQKNLQQTQAQEQIGTLAQLDVVTAQSQLASSQQALIVAQTTELQQQTVLLNLISRNPMAAGLENVQIVPTGSINTPPQVNIIPYRDAVAEAWNNRPDLLAQELSLDNANIGVKGARNALLPALTLTGNYSSEGLAGNQIARIPTGPAVTTANQNAPIVDATGNPVLINGQEIYSSSLTTPTTTRASAAGLLDAWNTMYNNNFPAYSLGLTLSIPLQNRSAKAADARAQLTQRESMLQVQSLKNTIAESVRNAQIGVQQGMARVQAAVKAVQLAQESLDAEQKKFQYGTSTDYNVILQERDLASAQGSEIQAKAGLLEAVVAFNQAMGLPLLHLYNISVAQAQSGRASRTPQIPGTPMNNSAPPPNNK